MRAEKMEESPKPVMSQNSDVQQACDFNITLYELTDGYEEVGEIKDFVRNRVPGVLVAITCEKPSLYKIFCFNSLRLHWCVYTDCLYEVKGKKNLGALVRCHPLL